MQSHRGVVVMLQIQHVPDVVLATLTERAARSGMSLSEYALAEPAKVAARPTLADVQQRIAAGGGASPQRSPGRRSTSTSPRTSPSR